jgi:hypothetical protein
MKRIAPIITIKKEMTGTIPIAFLINLPHSLPVRLPLLIVISRKFFHELLLNNID